MQPQRLLVPLFQRPYVWNEELQWEPLWKDLERVADRLLQSAPGAPQAPHFLGAVVLQQLQNQTSDLQQRTVIDGQQRLTTLQLMLDALHAEIEQAGAKMPAARLVRLIANEDAFCTHKEDRFKVWPTTVTGTPLTKSWPRRPRSTIHSSSTRPHEWRRRTISSP